MSDDVPEADKTACIIALQALRKQIQSELNAAVIGRVMSVGTPLDFAPQN